MFWDDKYGTQGLSKDVSVHLYFIYILFLKKNKKKAILHLLQISLKHQPVHFWIIPYMTQLFEHANCGETIIKEIMFIQEIDY